MPREARVILPGAPHHIVQRAHNRIQCFRSDQNYQLYLSWLEEYVERTECHLHAFVILESSVHLLVTPERLWSIVERARCGKAAIAAASPANHATYLIATAISSSPR